jgi:xanthine dehydrogenase YagR molybdenum-binding subunit
MIRTLYDTKYKALEDYEVITNEPPGKPFRAPGGPQALFALEGCTDELAHERGEDALVMRRRWDANPVRKRLYDWAMDQDVWRNRDVAGAQTGRFRTGIGVAAGTWLLLHMPSSQVRVDAGPDGVKASSSCQDIGTGSRTVLAWALAEQLGLKPTEIEVNFGDSRAPEGPMSAGSRTTGSIVPAGVDAADKLKRELLRVAKSKLGLEEAEIATDGVKHTAGVMPWRELLSQAPRITVVGRGGKDKDAKYVLPFPSNGLLLARTSQAAVMLAQVTVDTRFGRVEVDEVWMGIGAGKMLVPPLAQSQVEGAIIQGIGYALYEERRLCPKTGKQLTLNLEDYRIPGIGDVPPIHVHFDETPIHNGGGIIAGIGELATVPCAAAIANAVHHALGKRPKELPLRPDRVLELLS